MRIFKKILLGILVIVLLFIGYIAQITIRFDLLVNPIAHKIIFDVQGQPWGKRVDLLPEPFDDLQNRVHVERKLKRAGFKRIADSKVWARYNYEIENGREIYSRDASRIPCKIKLYVFVEYNQNDRLVFAEGAQHEHGCL